MRFGTVFDRRYKSDGRQRSRSVAGQSGHLRAVHDWTQHYSDANPREGNVNEYRFSISL
jgi:hypothetical protein